MADEVGLDAAARPTGLGAYQLIVAASLVESEAKVKEDRPLIASVISNRLQKGMKLQIDATVLYAIGHKDKVLYKDLEVDSPYNTYKIDGLPPTPISAVGRASLEAMLHPADTTYIYYVLSDKNGKHAFATTAVRVRGAEGRSPPQGPDMSSAGRPPLSGHTRVVGVIGDPVTHSLSPTLHNAAFEALGLDWVYVAFPVPRGRGADAVAAVPALGLAGLNVTMPHKEDVAGACDELTADAAALRSVNTVVAQPDGRTLGDSTDGPGFLDALADEAIAVGRAARPRARRRRRRPGHRPRPRPGGGGRHRRRPPARRRRGGRRPRPRRPGRCRSGAVDPSPFAVVVNATPLGMSGGDPLPVDPESLHAGQAVVDLVYHPADTPLLTAARAQGATAVNGLGMLLHQAARSFTLVDRSACAARRHAGGGHRRPGRPLRSGGYRRGCRPTWCGRSSGERRRRRGRGHRPAGRRRRRRAPTARLRVLPAPLATRLRRRGRVTLAVGGGEDGGRIGRWPLPPAPPAAASAASISTRPACTRLRRVLQTVNSPPSSTRMRALTRRRPSMPVTTRHWAASSVMGPLGRRFGDEPGPGLDRRDDGDDLPPLGHPALGLRQQPGDVDAPFRRPRRPPFGLELERCPRCSGRARSRRRGGARGGRRRHPAEAGPSGRRPHRRRPVRR